MNDTTLTLIDILVKSTAVLLLGFGCITMLRHRSAAHRSLAWLVVFVIMLALPFAALVKPVWSVPVHVVSKQISMTPRPPTAAPIIIAQESQPVVAPIHQAAPWTLWQWLAGVYAVGALGVIAFRWIGSWQLAQLRRQARTADAEIVALVHQLSPDRRVMTLVSDDIAVPMTWGTLKPILLLPSSVHQWSASDLRAALEHELAHIRHRDAARRWLGTLASALWWPHPLVWIASKAWKLEQERACDDAVVRSGANAERYATQLIEAAHSVRLGGFQSAAALVMAMPSGLETRLKAVVSSKVNRDRVGRMAGGIATICTASLTACVTLCQAQTVTPKADEPKQIYITAKFIGVQAPNIFSDKSASEAVTAAFAKVKGPLSDKEFQKLIRSISQQKGVDLMAAPSLTMKPGQKARLEVTREFALPTTAKNDNAPVVAGILPVGVMMDVVGTIDRDGGTIHLEIAPLVREFEGYGAQPQPDQPANPIFSEYKWSGKTSLFAGESSVHQLQMSPPPVNKTDPHLSPRMWVIVTAQLIAPLTEPSQASARPAATGPTYTVFGQVRNQGKYPLKTDQTVADAVRAAGGVSPFANSKGMWLNRIEGSKTQRFTLDLETHGATPLKPNDTLIVMANATALASPSFNKACRIEIPLLELDKASLPQCVDYLRKKAKEFDPEHQGVNIVLAPGIATSAGDYGFVMRNTTLDSALQSLADYYHVTLSYGPDAITITQPLLVTKAMTLKLPKVELKDATFDEAIEYLRAKSRELDPDKQGVNIVVREGAGKTAKLTLGLPEVSLHDALMYVAELGNAELAYEGNAVVMRLVDDGANVMVTRVYRLPIDALSTTAKDWLLEKKVVFGEGASAVFDPKTHQLIVKNTMAELVKVEALVGELPAAKPAPTK